PVTVLLFGRLSPSVITYEAEATLEVTIGFTEKPPQSSEVIVTLQPPVGESRQFTLPLSPDAPGSTTFLPGRLPFSANVIGTWKYQIVWPKNADHRETERSGSFDVGAGEGQISLEVTNDFVKPGQELRFSGQLTPNLADQPIRLQVIRPGTEIQEQVPTEFITSPTGRFEARFTPDTDGVWRFRALWDGLQDADGQQLYLSTKSPFVEATVLFPSGKVVIAVGGTPTQYWESSFLRLGLHVYDIFVQRGFLEKDMIFLSPLPPQDISFPRRPTRFVTLISPEWGEICSVQKQPNPLLSLSFDDSKGTLAQYRPFEAKSSISCHFRVNFTPNRVKKGMLKNEDVYTARG
ncbi:MAG: hypothetical protein O7E52_07095, partial [Candidatus Poribacteria bacterium]|nr:hypothetical protein [Candidatus Poribacteria bacterium]